MKIAFQATFNYGGLGTYSREMIKHLADKVESIDVFATSRSLFKKDEILKSIGKENVSIHTTSNILFDYYRDLKYLKSSDIVHVNYATFGLSALMTKKLYNLPYIYTTHTAGMPYIYTTQRVDRSVLGDSMISKIGYIFETCLFLPHLAKNSNLFIADSYHAKNMIMSAHNIEANVIYLGVDPRKFYPDKDSRVVIRHLLGIKDDDILLLYVGKLAKGKEIITLIKAMPNVIKKFKNIKLIIIGSGEEYFAIKKKIVEEKLHNYISILTNVGDDLNKYYQGADIFVFPSIGENFGLVLAEAMSSGLPIIAANMASSPEIIADAGLLFKPMDHEDMANKIINVLENEKLYKYLQNKSLERAKEFTWEKTAKNYYLIYKQLSS